MTGKIKQRRIVHALRTFIGGAAPHQNLFVYLAAARGMGGRKASQAKINIIAGM